MGKQVKRVPVNLDWPRNKAWWGYELSEVMCQACGGRGSQVRLLTPELLKKGDFQRIAERERCPTCDGRGRVRPVIEIPEGTGYQLWDASFSGCPVSPVFQSPEELARWLSKEKVPAFSSFTLPYEKWLEFLCEKDEIITSFIQSDLDQCFDLLDERVTDFIDKLFEDPDQAAES